MKKICQLAIFAIFIMICLKYSLLFLIGFICGGLTVGIVLHKTLKTIKGNLNNEI